MWPCSCSHSWDIELNTQREIPCLCAPLHYSLFRLRRNVSRELKQSRRRRQQKPHKFAYLTMKNSIFARFARAFFIFWHFADVLVLSTTWNDVFCSCVDDVSIWWQMFIFVFLCPKRWFQFNSRIVRTHFSNIMTLSNWKMIAEPRSYIFRWHSRFRRCRVCLSSLIISCLGAASQLHRGFHTDAEPDDRPPDISHLVFVVHGIGQLLHMSNIVKSCTE